MGRILQSAEPGVLNTLVVAKMMGGLVKVADPGLGRSGVWSRNMGPSPGD